MKKIQLYIQKLIFQLKTKKKIFHYHLMEK